MSAPTRPVTDSPPGGGPLHPWRRPARPWDSDFLRTWLRWFLLILVGLSAPLLPLILMLETSRIELLAARESRNVDATQQLLGNHFNERLGDLRVLADAPAVRRYLRGEDPAAGADATRLFQSVCRAYGEYDQIRLIRLDGQELLRVNHAGGRCLPVPTGQLQNKFDRYYFLAASRLQPGQTYASPLDLNIEHGRVEVPHKPMLRFATPIDIGQGSSAAVLVVNYLAQHLLDTLFAFNGDHHGTPPPRDHLLDPRGYYLRFEGAPQREFGFMLGREQERFDLHHPAAWSALQRGQPRHQDRHGLYLLATLSPPIAVPPGGQSDAGPVPAARWHLVRFIPRANLLRGSLLHGPQRWLWIGLYLLVILTISGLWTQLRRRDEEVASSRQTLKALFDEAPDGILTVNQRGRITMINAHGCALFGYTDPEELVGRPVETLIPMRLRQAHVQHRGDFLRQPSRREMAVSGDLHALRRDGSEFPALISLNTLRLPRGQETICVVRDITAHTTAERELVLFRTMIEQAGEPFYVADLDDGVRMIHVNEAAVRHFGVPRETLHDWRVTDWEADLDPAMVPALVTRIREESPLLLERLHRVQGGRTVPVEVSINYHVDRHGRQFAYGWFKDITARRETARLEAEARQRAEAANRAKTAFLANMSHEIRTPLNRIIGGTWLLRQRPALPAGIGEELGRIHNAGQLLLALVNDILDLSKIEAGELNLEQIPMQLEGVLNEIESVATLQAQQKGLSLHIDSLPDGASGHVIGDPVRLRQILLNLVNNAIKFTAEGTVRLRVDRLATAPPGADEAAQQCLRFVVEDSGIGIEPQLLSTLFEPFKQADTSTTRTHGGTGLGLTIVRELVERLGGRIDVDSRPGEGSRFSVTLPFVIASQAQMEAAGLFRKQLRILLAVQDPTQRARLAELCQGLGWEVDAVADGEALLERYAALGQQERLPDCLLIDWQLPRLDGLAALHRIHEIRGLRRLPSVLMIDAQAREALGRTAHAELPDALLHKPFGVTELFNQVNLAFVRRLGSRDSLASNPDIQPAAMRWLPGIRILLVDDSPMNLDIASEILRHQGAEVSTCQDGAQALAWLKRAGNPVDIVLMDIQMPVMDGNTAVREIRATASLAGLPVVALTAAALSSEREKSLAAGMDDYLTKPFDPERMTRVIRQQIERVRGAPVPVEPADAPVAGAPAGPWPRIPGLRIETVRHRLGERLPLFMDLLRRFLDDNHDLHRPPPVPGDQAGQQALRARLHKFAGQAGGLGAEALHALAREIELALQDGRLAALPGLLARLATELQDLDLASRAPLARHAAQTDADRPSTMPLDARQQAELLEALRQQKLSATQLYRALEPALRQTLPAANFQALDAAIQRLDFTTAIEQLTRHPGH